MRFLTRFLTFTLIGWVAIQVAAKATTNEQQEIRAEMICLQDPTACGL